MRTRFKQLSLELHGEKTRLLEFGRYAIGRRQRNGQGKPQTFNFLGFTFICGRSRRGVILLLRHTRRDRVRAALGEIKDEMRRRYHDSLADQGRWLRSVAAGYFAYQAVPTSAQAIGAYRHHVLDLWRRSLMRRSQKGHVTWARMDRLAAEGLPPPHVQPPWPEERMASRAGAGRISNHKQVVGAKGEGAVAAPGAASRLLVSVSSQPAANTVCRVRRGWS